MIFQSCYKVAGSLHHMAPVKREAGESPARTRRCKRGVLLRQDTDSVKCRSFVKGNSLGQVIPGRGSKMLILKSEDLPVM